MTVLKKWDKKWNTIQQSRRGSWACPRIDVPLPVGSCQGQFPLHWIEAKEKGEVHAPHWLLHRIVDCYYSFILTLAVLYPGEESATISAVIISKHDRVCLSQHKFTPNTIHIYYLFIHTHTKKTTRFLFKRCTPTFQ